MPKWKYRRHAVIGSPKRFLRRIRRAYKMAKNPPLGFGLPTPPDQVLDFIRLARPVGATTPLVRIGGDADGGYLVPDDLDGLAACISPGVSTEVSFDRAMADSGVPVIMADRSVDGPPEPNPLYHFIPKHLDVLDDEHHIRLASLCDLVPVEATGDFLLQMDIEGAEYPVLIDASDEVLRRFRIIVIEFHIMSGLFDLFRFRIIRAVFAKLKRSHHIVHIHANNAEPIILRDGIPVPPLLEMTFHRRDRVTLVPDASPIIPHPLDRDNVHDRRPLPLPRVWYAD